MGVDAPALIQTLGKADDAKTFGDPGKIFVNIMMGRFNSSCTRLNVQFKKYQEESIKSRITLKRPGSLRLTSRVIDSVS